jgi:hypothetical protein
MHANRIECRADANSSPTPPLTNVSGEEAANLPDRCLYAGEALRRVVRDLMAVVQESMSLEVDEHASGNLDV